MKYRNIDANGGHELHVQVRTRVHMTSSDSLSVRDVLIRRLVAAHYLTRLQLLHVVRPRIKQSHKYFIRL